MVHLHRLLPWWRLLILVPMLGLWIGSTSCVTSAVLRPHPDGYRTPVTAEVKPQSAKLYITGIHTDDTGRRCFQVMLADYLVGHPAGQGLSFEVTETPANELMQVRLSDGMATHPVPPRATPIQILDFPIQEGPIRDLRTWEDQQAARLLPALTSDLPNAVMATSTYNDDRIFISFWYRDPQGGVRSGMVSLVFNNTWHTSAKGYLNNLNVVWTVPADVVVTAGVVVACVLILPVLAFEH